MVSCSTSKIVFFSFRLQFKVNHSYMSFGIVTCSDDTAHLGFFAGGPSPHPIPDFLLKLMAGAVESKSSHCNKSLSVSLPHFFCQPMDNMRIWEGETRVEANHFSVDSSNLLPSAFTCFPSCMNREVGERSSQQPPALRPKQLYYKSKAANPWATDLWFSMIEALLCQTAGDVNT